MIYITPMKIDRSVKNGVFPSKNVYIWLNLEALENRNYLIFLFIVRKCMRDPKQCISLYPLYCNQKKESDAKLNTVLKCSNLL